MAPEVFQRTRPYSAAADIFSLALVFSELLTLQIPFADIGTHASAAASMATDQARPCLPHNCINGLKHLIGQGETHTASQYFLVLALPFSHHTALRLTQIDGVFSCVFSSLGPRPGPAPDGGVHRCYAGQHSLKYVRHPDCDGHSHVRSGARQRSPV
jgi:hypothetical protein